MIRAIVLDFDGVIIDTESALIEAYADVCRHHGVSLPDLRFREETGRAEFSFDPWSLFPPALDRRTLEAERRAASEARFARLPAMAGVEDLLQEARVLGVPAGIASNSLRPHVEHHLCRLGLQGFFRVIAARGEGHPPKPEPHLYLHAVKILGALPVEAVAFEDSETGVRAARTAGFMTVAIPNRATRDHDFSLANLQLRSLEEFSLESLVAAGSLRSP